MSGPILRAREITFGYQPGHPVLTDLSLDVPAGMILALVGANGSGKSTLLKLLAGILRPQSGRIELAGADLATFSRRAVARRIAVVPQGELPDSHLTVRELVALGRHPWQGRLDDESEGDRAAIARALQETQLTDFAGRLVSALSGGERRRVQAATALAQDPSILLLDEPTTFLDIRHQIELLELMAGGSRQEGRTAVMILHDLNLAASYADRLALLVEGRLWAEGSPSAVLTPANIAAAYGIEAAVIHGTGGRPHVIPRVVRRRAPGSGPRVHMIGGGGAAANLLADLAGRGYHLSLGVANQGDLDAAVAAEWDLETILVPPASPISPEAAAACRGMMQGAACVIVANAPFGPGNLENLRLALAARRAGQPVLLVAEDPIAARDFTDGRAIEIYQELLAAGAQEVTREQMAADRLEEMLRR